MGSLVLSLVLLVDGGRPAKAPPLPSETAKLFFLAGDLAKAVEWARNGVKTEPDRCRPLLKALAEYGALANHTDELTAEQARAFLQWDREISPSAPGKITQSVIARLVTGPLELALRAEAQGRLADARRSVIAVLAVDPKHADALALQRRLELPGDGGLVARDGGR